MNNKDILNEEITFDVIKVIKHDGAVEIMRKDDALRIAKEMALDLWLVCEENFPPLCAIVNYNKVQEDHPHSPMSRGQTPTKRGQITPQSGPQFA